MYKLIPAIVSLALAAMFISADVRPAPAPLASRARAYVLNTNTMRFHDPSCYSVDRMKPKNRLDVTETRDYVIALGFAPCKNCNP